VTYSSAENDMDYNISYTTMKIILSMQILNGNTQDLRRSTNEAIQNHIILTGPFYQPPLSQS